MNVLEVNNLSKHYRRLRGGRQVAIADLDLSVGAGGVFGFLGPNGSGKTTTIRCLLGLVRPTSGSARLFGCDAATELQKVIGRVGAIVESPALFPTFTARRNLELLADTTGIDRRRVDAVLETVGLRGRDRELVKGYSLGMRQRLGIAAALLKDPDLLILDEPANGLDPAGIKEVRQLLRRLGEEGRTVFLSSHLLTEVQQTCDHVAIIARGRCVASGPVDQILGGGAPGGVLVRISDPLAALAALRAAHLGATQVGHGQIEVTIEPKRSAVVTEVLARRGLYVSELRAREVDLETVFLELTREDEEVAVA